MTPEDRAKLLAAYPASDHAIARRFGVHVAQVRRARIKAGLPPVGKSGRPRLATPRPPLCMVSTRLPRESYSQLMRLAEMEGASASKLAGVLLRAAIAEAAWRFPA